jgi:hypothetical protein
VEACPRGAITLTVESSRAVRAVIHHLTRAVNVH